MAWDAAGKRELLEKFFHTGFVLRDVRIQLAVSAFEIGVGDDGGSAVAGAGNEDGIEIVLFDEAIEVDVNEIQSGCGAPMAEETRFDVLKFERLFEQGIVV